MLAVRLHLDGLRVEEIETPSPGPGGVLVRVHAAAITRDELEWPEDRLPAIVSYELSGVVVDTGEEVYALTPFDRDGVAAEYAVVPSTALAPKPARLSHTEAAALPMGGLTAWQGLFVHGKLSRGERVLVTGAAGGVGHLAAQLAGHAGAHVVEGGPADLVFDTAGGELPSGERIVTIAAEAPGATYFVVEPNRDELIELGRLADTDRIRPTIDSTFPLARAHEAFARLAARGKRGKVVLEIREDRDLTFDRERGTRRCQTPRVSDTCSLLLDRVDRLPRDVHGGGRLALRERALGPQPAHAVSHPSRPPAATSIG